MSLRPDCADDWIVIAVLFSLWLVVAAGLVLDYRAKHHHPAQESLIWDYRDSPEWQRRTRLAEPQVDPRGILD